MHSFSLSLISFDDVVVVFRVQVSVIICHYIEIQLIFYVLFILYPTILLNSFILTFGVCVCMHMHVLVCMYVNLLDFLHVR